MVVETLGQNAIEPLKKSYSAILIISVSLLLATSSGCVPYSVLSNEVTAGEEVLVLGVWFEGSTIVDPRPAKSKYFKVYEGGFKTSQHGARCWLLADIIQEVPTDLWAVVESENPIERDKPFIDEGLVKVGAKSFYYDGTRYVWGLKMFTTYWVKVTLYDFKDKKETLDQFTQKIKVYVDTTRDTVLIAKGTTERRS